MFVTNLESKVRRTLCQTSFLFSRYCLLAFVRLWHLDLQQFCSKVKTTGIVDTYVLNRQTMCLIQIVWSLEPRQPTTWLTSGPNTHLGVASVKQKILQNDGKQKLIRLESGNPTVRDIVRCSFNVWLLCSLTARIQSIRDQLKQQNVAYEPNSHTYTEANSQTPTTLCDTFVAHGCRTLLWSQRQSRVGSCHRFYSYKMVKPTSKGT